MRLRPRPVGRGRAARAVGEEEADGDASPPHEGRDDPHRDEVEARVAQRLHRHLLAVEAEPAAEGAVPEVEDLVDVGEVLPGRRPAVRAREAEGDAAEVQAMGVGAEPLDLGRPPVARDVRVADRAPVRVELREAEALDREAPRVGGGVPAPLGEGAERNRLVVGLGKGLEAGRVGGERELAVPDRERRTGVEGLQGGVVAADERVSIDPLRRTRGRRPGEDDSVGEHGQHQGRRKEEPHERHLALIIVRI